MQRLIESIPYANLKNGTHLDIEVYYSKGGYGSRGYYVSVSPVAHNGATKSYTLFSGVRQLLLETRRYTPKQFETAVTMSREVIPELIQRVLASETAA